MVYRSLVRPLLFRLPPETAHELALHSLSLLRPKFINDYVARRYATSSTVHRFGISFPNVVGVAAGFDKNGIALEALAALGFGFIEAGTVTFHPQPGNPRPRLFRLPQDKALINRAGFNNDGAAAFVKRVEGHRPDCVLGVSIGKSKITPLGEATENYLLLSGLPSNHFMCTTTDSGVKICESFAFQNAFQTFIDLARDAGPAIDEASV